MFAHTKNYKYKQFEGHVCVHLLDTYEQERLEIVTMELILLGVQFVSLSLFFYFFYLKYSEFLGVE